MVVTSIDIPDDIHERCKREHWRFIEIFLLGMKAKDNNPQLISRINELEENTKKLNNVNTYYKEKYFELQDKIDKLGLNK